MKGSAFVKALVIVPTFNERENIRRLVYEVLAVESRVDILIVDDDSPDGTGAIADEIVSVESRVHVLHRAGKLGLGTAYVDGFRWALERDYDRIVEMDADFSHRPVDLPRLIDATLTADVAIGSRNIKGGKVENWSLLRKAISRGGSLYTRLLLGVNIHDCTSGFKCFRRNVLETIDFNEVKSNGYGFQVEVNYLCYRSGFQMAEVPIIFPDRRVGKSKMSRRIVIEAATRVWELRRLPAQSRPAAAIPQVAAVQPASYIVEDRIELPVPAEPARPTPVFNPAITYQHAARVDEVATE